MSVISGTAPWQVGQVSSFGHISAGALAALAIDALFASPVLPSGLLVALFVLVPLTVAIRVVRGFDGSLPAAMTTFAAIAISSAGGLFVGGSAAVAARSALVVGLVVAIVGAAAALAAWLDRRRSGRPPVIEIALPSRDGLARARNRPRVYR